MGDGSEWLIKTSSAWGAVTGVCPQLDSIPSLKLLGLSNTSRSVKGTPSHSTTQQQSPIYHNPLHTKLCYGLGLESLPRAEECHCHDECRTGRQGTRRVPRGEGAGECHNHQVCATQGGGWGMSPPPGTSHAGRAGDGVILMGGMHPWTGAEGQPGLPAPAGRALHSLSVWPRPSVHQAPQPTSPF